LQRAFRDAALGHFGSGWAWLVAAPGDRLAVLTTHDADTPLRDGPLPLLTCDLWEHAWYLDRRQDKAAYVKAFWQVANWSFAAANLARAAALGTKPPGRRAKAE
jgi:Fe-Mn family superoxide dismutase